MALNCLTCPKDIYQIIFCVDSKSVLQAIQSLHLRVRSEMIIEISHLIHVLSLRGTGNGITFCWLPSHCGFYFNEKVDKAAKARAKHSLTSIQMTIPYKSVILS